MCIFYYNNMINKFLTNLSKNKFQYAIYGGGIFYAIYIHKTFFDMIKRDTNSNKCMFNMDKENKKILH